MTTESGQPKTRKARRRRQDAGPPGTIVADPEAPQPVIRVMAYGPEQLHEAEVQSVEEIRELRGKWPVLWVNVDSLGSAETVAKLGELFALHKLALEDVTAVHQRPKVESYGEYAFMVVRMLFADGKLRTEQMSLFLGKDFLLTFQERPGDCFDPVRERIRKGQGRLRQTGQDYLTYCLLDAIIDSYFPVLDTYGDALEDLEQEVIEKADQKMIARILGIKRDLMTLRRVLWPMREALSSLQRDCASHFTEETRIYLRDCYDHTFQVIDTLENYRETALGLLDVYLSSVSNRMNSIMKVLTIIATIFMPLSFIAGLYGMNFNPQRSPLNMPELNWYWGYPYALTLMAAVVAGMLVYFRRKQWL